MIRLRATRCRASADEAQAALAGLGAAPGLYLGVDGGLAGLHPLQATLVDRPAIALHLSGHRIEARPLTGFGAALLRAPELVEWSGSAARGGVLDGLRSFLRCFEPVAEAMLVGAVPFAAHGLRRGGGQEPLGVLYFPQTWMKRDAAGEWQRVELVAEGVAPQPEPPPPLETGGVAAAPEGDDLPPGGYADMVGRAVAVLKERPLVSLTLSQAYRRRVEMAPIDAFRRLRDANPAPATFFFNDGAGECLLGASPDLQLVIESGVVTALPVCGTVARGAGAVGEAESLRELIDEEVDAASLAVCTDALRTDLAPLCEPGSLELLDRRRPMALATVIHAVDRLQGRLRAGCDAWDAIAATAAPVMVTGTPRDEALRAIAELEPSGRGWYGGMMVQVNGAGDALVGTILRAAAVRGGVASVRTGGDLLATSSPPREEQESRLKTRSLWRAFGLEPAAVSRVSAATGNVAAPAVAVVDEGDAFGAALRDCVQGLGIAISGSAPVRVVAGSRRIDHRERLVAVGDAAMLVLQAEGFAVEPCTPRHGELVRCVRADNDEAFVAARYLRWVVVDARLPAGWDVWASDESGAPQVLVQRERRVACFLFRPDSLLSQPAAVQLFADAIGICAAV